MHTNLSINIIPTCVQAFPFPGGMDAHQVQYFRCVRRKTCGASALLVFKMIIYQDRLGTNIGKVLKRDYRLIAQAADGIDVS